MLETNSHKQRKTEYKQSRQTHSKKTKLLHKEVNKPEVHNTNIRGATCASNKEKNLRVLRNKNEIGTKLTTKNEREFIQSVKVKIKPIKITNPDIFQMQYFQIPGTHEPSETPVTPTTKEGPTRVFENSDQADTSDDDDDENPQADTPNLMREISEALARPEIGVFKAGESEEDQECQSDNDTTKTENNHEKEETDDNPKAIEDEASDTDSIRTVEFSASESAQRDEKSEDDEIIEITADEDELDNDNPGESLPKTTTKAWRIMSLMI